MHIIENLIINFVYAAFGILMTLAAMYYGTILLDKMTDFDTSDQIKAGNTAAGIVYGCLLIGISIAVGQVVAAGLN
jgi:uncharacterized membrane protein YjfL (UPF0719 family)